MFFLCFLFSPRCVVGFLCFSLYIFSTPPPPQKEKGSCFLEETFDVERNSALLRVR